jgi:multidrug efflux pump subunit AcrB
MDGGHDNRGRWIGLFFDNRYLLALTILVTLVAGFSALKNLPRQEDPVITNRNPMIVTVFPGASADRVEALVSEPIEQALDEVSEIKDIGSTSRAGISIIMIEMKDEVMRDMVEPIHSEIRDKIDQAAANFPPEVVPPDYDTKRNPVAYTMITALYWADQSKGAESLGILARQGEEMASRLRRIPGTEIVRLYGKPEEEVLVTIDAPKLAQLGLTPRDVSAALSRADVKVPAGQLRSETSSLLLEVDGKIDSVDRVRSIILKEGGEGGSGLVRVGDVAAVSRGWQEPAEQVGFTEGQRAIYVAARISEDQRVDLWDAAAVEVVEDFRLVAGGAVTVENIFRQSTYTTDRLASLAGNLLLGSFVVLLVIFLTMGWRRSLIVSAALPLTAAGTLFVLSMQGGKLHQMSIFGMIVALGLLIDTAIVITDEVRKFLLKGLSRREATVAALRHLFVPLLSSTLTSVLAFMPILLLPGGAGDFVGSIGGSVIIAISLSFVLSVTVIAALAGRFSEHRAESAVKKTHRLPTWAREGIEARWFSRPMRALITAGIRRPLLGIAMGAALPVAGFVLAQSLGSQFFPRTDRDMFTVEVELSSTTSVAKSEAVGREIDAMMRELEGIEKVHWLAGASFPPVYYNMIENRDNSSEFVMAVIDADSSERVDSLVPQLQRQLDESFPEALVQVKKFAQGPPSNADVEFRIFGPSISTLQALGDEVQRRVAEHPGIIQAKSTMTRGEPKLVFEADEEAVRTAGLDLASVADQLQTNLEGLTGGTLLEAVEELPIRVRAGAEDRAEPGTIADLRVVGAAGAKIPLRSLGSFDLRPEPGTVTRRNGERVNTVRGYAASGALPIDITRDVRSGLEASGFQLPVGYRMEIGGEAENQGNAVGNLMLYLPVLLVLTIAVLILSFRSVRVMLILGASAVLAVGYGLLATWGMQFPISFNTIIGCIGLVGLAFNDNIVVLASVYSNAKAKAGDVDAIVDEIMGCGRHLISTTLTTIGSFLPLLLIIGGNFWPPLAIVLAGGVGGATFLAAVFTPAAYRLLVARKFRERQLQAAEQTLPIAATAEPSPA